jgi:hypothetical protein
MVTTEMNRLSYGCCDGQHSLPVLIHQNGIPVWISGERRRGGVRSRVRLRLRLRVECSRSRAVDVRDSTDRAAIRRRLNLGEKSFCADDSRELGSQNFYCDKAIVLDVLREVNGRHSARAELSLDAVAIRKCSGESLRWVAHRAQCVTKYT